jgi:dolichol-phosphate mannosyltransferase|tara:strand:+ start:33 stop:725 length:693 start_codon:yes stop_codon:yes gene_type:complete
MKFSIVIPVHNEAENILKLINEINNTLKDEYIYEIIVVDDKSTDNTLKILSENIKNTSIIKNINNMGQSFSLHKGIMKSNYKTIVTMDGDGQNNPLDIKKLFLLFNEENNLDLIAGIRRNRQDSIIKILSSKLANFIRRLILKDHCVDTGCSLKIFKKNSFLEFPYFDGMHRFIPSLFEGFGFKAKYIEVDHRKRIGGKSKYGTIDRLFKGINDLIIVKKIINNKNLNNV